MRYLFPFFLSLAPPLTLCSQPHLAYDKNPAIEAMMSQVSEDSLKLYVEKLVSFGTRHSLSDTVSDSRGIGAARRWVLSKFRQFSRENGNRLHAYLDPFTVPEGRRIPAPVLMKNTMAVLPGTDTAHPRYLVVSGHLDSRVSDVMNSTDDAPGANDDASGVALVIELARIMSKYEFGASIIFVAVQGEEQGLLGAAHLAEKLKADSAMVIAMFNNDMVGNTASSETNLNDASRMRIFSETIPAVETDNMQQLRQYTGAENDSRSRQLARYIKNYGESYVNGFDVVLNYRVDRYLRGGDHIPFTRQGFTAVRFCEMNENYLHQHQDVRMEDGAQYGDLTDYVNFAYAANITRVNLVSLASLANAPLSPEDPGIKLALGNVSTLEWNPPSAGPAPRGYYVLIRETYEANWSQKIFVTETSASIPFSKDNYFFAVQSVGNDGSTSLPVLPAPRRN